MRIFRAFSNSIQQPSFDQADAGGGGGAAGAGGQQGGGQGVGGGAGASGTPGGGSGASAPVAYSDDMQITRDGKTMTMKEFISSQYVPKSEFDNVRNLTRQEIETNLRKLATQLAQQKQPQQRQQPVDPFAKVRGVPIVDGDTLAAVAEAGFGQVAQTINAQQQRLQQLENHLKKISGGVATLGKERSSQERTSRVSQAIASLGEGYDAKDPLLNDVAQDLIDAWEFNSEAEFHTMLANRVSAFEKMIRARDKAQLAAAKTRRFVRPGGGATPSGAPHFDHKNAASQAADMLFGVRGANT